MLVCAVSFLATQACAHGKADKGETVSGSERTGAVLENEYVRYVIGADGLNLHFAAGRTHKDYCVHGVPFARVTKAGKTYDASAVSSRNGRIEVEFGVSGIRAAIGATVKKHCFTLEVLSVSDELADELTFVDVQLTPEAAANDSFAACAMALNLKTNVWEIPGPNTRLRATCCRRFGFQGAKVAVLGCPPGEMRTVMKEVVSAAKDIPQSSLGGPWALDADINTGSYIFNFGGLSEDKVDEWIRLARSFGVNQIDFHGGSSFRFGDFRPNPETYPNGLAGLKAVIDKLHAAGIKAGLHPYAFFIDKGCPWVTPVPDPRLGKDATFTLAEDLSPDSSTLPVVEPTRDMSATTGFFVRNSVTLQVEDELITYTGISKEPPYAFTGCRRGAYGTRVAAHSAGAKVSHLKECFGLFAPDGDSTLLTEVAVKAAEMFNECGFDMIYLDALDGEDILGGPENGWHYGSKFVFELCRRLKKPALIEMSTFHHHLWYVRSRMGAWDHPSRGQKKFVDLHCAVNESARKMFLPTNLGWWAVLTGEGSNETQIERTYPDDIEYLMCKCIGTDSGFSLTGYGPETPAYLRLRDIFRQYEDLRHAGYFPESVKSKLRVPGDEFMLEQGASGKWQFRRVDYAKHKVDGADGSKAWVTRNRFDRQPVQLRVEALMSAGAYDSPESKALVDFARPGEFADRAAETGVTAEMQASTDVVKAGQVSGCYTASNGRSSRDGAWSRIGRTFSPQVDIAQHRALGVWICGDGQGEVLNLQLRSPQHISGAMGEHYVCVDFNGWRYFELLEPEGDRVGDYSWPYSTNYYGLYREFVDYGYIESLSLWYNNLPPGKQVRCYLSSVKALPLVRAKLRNPRITIAGKTIVFPVEMESGCWLEFRSMSDCKLYAPNGEVVAEVKPEGEAPVLAPGDNNVEFDCAVSPDVRARACVTVISCGGVLGE
jgi:hypothetical protein